MPEALQDWSITFSSGLFEYFLKCKWSIRALFTDIDQKDISNDLFKQDQDKVYARKEEAAKWSHSVCTWEMFWNRKTAWLQHFKFRKYPDVYFINIPLKPGKIPIIVCHKCLTLQSQKAFQLFFFFLRNEGLFLSFKCISLQYQGIS